MPSPKHRTPEDDRLAETKNRTKNWRRWGPYLTERQWGTVREDYSSDGEAWNHSPLDHAPYRPYRLAVGRILWLYRIPILLRPRPSVCLTSRSPQS